MELIEYQLSNDVQDLARTDLWWITADMTKLVWHTATKSEVLPDWTPDAAQRDGLIVWENGIPLEIELPVDDARGLSAAGLTGPPMKTVQVAGISWHIDGDDRRLAYFTADPRMTVGSDEGRWVTPWVTAPAPLAPIPRPKPQPEIDALVMRLLAATMLISAEPTVATTRPASWARDVPAKSRRSKEVPAVKVIALREVPAPRSAHEHGDSDREYTHRWIVKDHTRTYWTGPGSTVKEERWIAPYVAGPEHLPLLVKETVRIWRR
ncbi:hypothetical protein [Gordonia sihwensis]|uniref:hypothetical protein n=1 Tax=Gordonia sihwensis TaxID=173559 RepID=UPI0005EDAE5A|nr:hypothetical protein [Gordonia sihwensis]KJR10253.1 hypothetical protein UG54_01350 [Gordonia sihwensis]